MSKLNRDDVFKLARLARLSIADDEIERYQQELNDILRYVELLQDVDVAGLEPTSQVTGLTNVTRPDTVRQYGYDPRDLLDNVPAVEAAQIKVKRML